MSSFLSDWPFPHDSDWSMHREQQASEPAQPDFRVCVAFLYLCLNNSTTNRQQMIQSRRSTSEAALPKGTKCLWFCSTHLLFKPETAILRMLFCPFSHALQMIKCRCLLLASPSVLEWMWTHFLHVPTVCRVSATLQVLFCFYHSCVPVLMLSLKTTISTCSHPAGSDWTSKKKKE